MRDYVWAVEVTAMPEGSVTEDGEFTPGWEPPNWPEERASLKRAGLMRPEETEFFWPSMDKVWMSRSTATKRVKLLERYGATAHVVRSPLKWEVPGSASAAERASAEAKLDDLSAVLRSFTRKVRGDVLSESDVPGIELNEGLSGGIRQVVDHLSEDLELVVGRLGPVEAVLEVLRLLHHLVSELRRDAERLHDSSPSVGGRRNPQPTEGEANAVRAAARELADEHWPDVGASRYYADNAAEVLNRIADRIEKGGDAA